MWLSFATSTLMILSIRLFKERIFGGQQLLISKNTGANSRHQARQKGRRRLINPHHVRGLIHELEILPSNKSESWNELAQRVGLHNIYGAIIRRRMKANGYRRTRKGIFYHRKEGLSGYYRERILNAQFTQVSSYRGRCSNESNFSETASGKQIT